MTLEAPYGDVTLDENRQGIIDTFVAQLVLDEESGEVVQQTVAIIPQVDQTFGGTFGPDTPPPSREDPPCEERDLPWVGQRHPGRRRRAADRRGDRRQRPGRHRADGHRAGRHGDHRRWQSRQAAGGDEAGMTTATTALQARRASRPSCSCATSSSPSAVCSPWAASTSTSPGASASPCSVPTAPARPRCSTSSPATSTRPRGTVMINGVDCTTAPSRRRAGLGVARTYQKTRLFPGLTVEDNLQLAWIGKHGSHRSLSRSGCRAPAATQRQAAAAGVARRSARHRRRRPVPRPATPARGRHGRRHRAGADDARRAGVRAVPW